MNVRHFVVAVSSAAILAGSSMGALAGSFGYAHSSSGVISVGTVICDVPLAVTIQHQDQSSMASGHGGASTTGGTFGGAHASTGSVSVNNNFWTGTTVTFSGPSASAGGGTYGSSCAGSNCGNTY